jgi:hypothetical protein
MPDNSDVAVSWNAYYYSIYIAVEAYEIECRVPTKYGTDEQGGKVSSLSLHHNIRILLDGKDVTDQFIKRGKDEQIKISSHNLWKTLDVLTSTLKMKGV